MNKFLVHCFTEVKMEKKLISVRTVVAIGIGAALVFVLMRFAAITTGIPNTYINFGIAVLSAFAAIFGPVAGFLIGFIGHTLADFTRGEVSWSWVIASAVYGLVVGLPWKLYKVEEGGFGLKQTLIFNAAQIVANLLCYVAVAPTLDIIIYKESVNIASLQSLGAAAVNIAVVLILGTLLLLVYSKSRHGSGST